MEANYISGIVRKSELDYTETWFAGELLLDVGLFQLNFDGKWHCTLVGDSCSRILQCSKEDFWAQFQKLNIHTSYHAPAMTVETLLQEMDTARQSAAFIAIFPDKDHDLRYIRGTLNVNLSHSGQLCILGQLADVTELRKRDVEARMKEEELRVTMAQAGEHVSYYDIETSTLSMSPATAETFGVAPTLENYPECYLEHPPAGITPNTMEKLRLFVEQIRRGEPSGYYDYSTVSVDGHRVWMHREYQTIFDEQDRPVRAVITSKNVTTQYNQLIQQESERAGLMQVAQMIFPEIISCNLTRGTYNILQGLPSIPRNLPLDDLFLACLPTIAPEDQEAFQQNFFRSYQMEAAKDGKNRFHLTYRRCTRDGVWHWVESMALVYTNPRNDDILSFTVSRGVDEEKAQEALQRRLRTDDLTDTYSRAYFLEKAEEMIRGEMSELYIVRVNICNFKLINELRGVEKGDKLLRSIGKRLNELGKEYGFIASRFTADHFYLCIRKEDFGRIEMFKRVSIPWLKMDISITYGVCPVDRKTPVNIMCDRATMALSANSNKRLENICYYDDSFHQQLIREQEIESEMENALAERQFCIYIQPKIQVETDHVIGGEALVRWKHPKKGMIPPFSFISVFEKNGFILPLDYYVWEESCRFLEEAKKKGLPYAPLSVNVSRLHFYSGELVDHLTGLLEKYHLEAKDLELEITESIYAEDPESILNQCGQLQDLGFKIAMDDFGSGFSSLNMLKNLPLDIIKMDLKFLSDDTGTQQTLKGRDILRTQIELAHTIGLDVVVEGLETKVQRDFIREIGNCAAQGYFYAKPMPAADFAELLQSSHAGASDLPARGVAAKLRRERLRREQIHPMLEQIAVSENIFGYLLPEKEGILSPHMAKKLECSIHIPDFGDQAASSGFIADGSLTQWRALIDAADRGEQFGEAVVECCVPQNGAKMYWLRFDMMIDYEGNPLIAIFSVSDFASISAQVDDIVASKQIHIEAENLQLKEQMSETQRIFKIVSEHSNRVLYVYDLATRTTRPWDTENERKDILVHLYTGTYSEEGLDQNKAVILEQKDEIKQFFKNIHGGVPTGELDIPVRLADGQPKWYHFKYSTIFQHEQPVSAVISVEDITEKKTAQIELKTRSERDGLTNLYNRDTAEKLIREKIGTDSEQGIFIILDLDRLKQINDSYGHDEGDKAIVSIAQTLKSHFRGSDIIARFGGDEFVIYMPGAAQNKDVITGTLTELLCKLDSLAVGENEEMGITCSIGCAVEQDDSTYETLFKQADRALYHVKKSGRNNFAFYFPEMEQDDFVYQMDKLFSLDRAKRYETGEIRQLITTLCDIYHLVIAFNITENSYHLMQEVRDGVFTKRPTFGKMDDIIEVSLKRMPPEDAERFKNAVSRQALIEADARGEKQVSVRFLTMDLHGTYRLAECNSILYRNAKNDLCEFTLIRWVNG